MSIQALSIYVAYFVLQMSCTINMFICLSYFGYFSLQQSARKEFCVMSLEM